MGSCGGVVSGGRAVWGRDVGARFPQDIFGTSHVPQLQGWEGGVKQAARLVACCQRG